MESLKQKALKRLGALKNARQPFEQHWRELSDYILPMSTRFFFSDAGQHKRNTKIINMTGGYASRTQTSGMMSGITSPSKPWFKLRTSDFELNNNHEVKMWLEAVSDRMSEIFIGSNFYQSISIVYQHLGTFATSAMLIEEDLDNVIRCETFPVGSYYLAQNSSQHVDTFYRVFMMTVAQLVSRFGEDNVSSSVNSLFKAKQYDQLIEVLHVIEINLDKDPRYVDKKEYNSMYFETGGDSDKVLRKAGFDEFPIMAPRWETNGEDVYGCNCPGMLALGTVKALQLEERQKNKIVDLYSNPAMIAPTSLRNERINLIPGGISYYDNSTGKQKIERAFEVDPGAIQVLRQDIAEYEKQINSAYFVDLFLMLASSDRRDFTATEILERKEEKLLMLGPVLSRLDNDFLDPAISRTFSIMSRRGMLPEPPEVLRDQEIKVEYISTLAQAQKSLGIQNIERFVSFTGQMAAVKPEILDNVNYDEIVKQYADMVGVDPATLLDEELVKQLRQAREEQQAQQQQMQSALAMTQGVKDLGGVEALSNVAGGGTQ